MIVISFKFQNIIINMLGKKCYRFYMILWELNIKKSTNQLFVRFKKKKIIGNKSNLEYPTPPQKRETKVAPKTNNMTRPLTIIKI